MKDRSQKEAHISVYAREHPTQSANQVYSHFKGSEYALRKTDALRVIREARNKPSVSEKKRLASIPKKYQKASSKPQEARSAPKLRSLPRFPPTKSKSLIFDRMDKIPNTYSVAHINTKSHTKNGIHYQGKTLHIKFNSRSKYESELYRLGRQYDFKPKDVNISFEGPFAYRGEVFVTPDFEKEMMRRGLW